MGDIRLICQYSNNNRENLKDLHMKKSLLLITLLILSISMNAQRRVIELNKKYTASKIYQHGKGTIGAKDMILVNDTLLNFKSITSEGTLRDRELSTSNVRFVKIKKGSYAGIGAAAGAGFGLLCSVYGVLSVKSDPTLDDSGVDWGPFIAAFTVGGAVIGTIAGLCIPKWRTYFLPDNRTSYTIKISPTVSPYYCGLGLKMKF
jgi:hypothetical protein